MRTFFLLTLALAAACRSGSLGHCSTDSDCPSGAVCDRSAKVCAVREGACFPACGEGFTCRSAACVDLSPPTIANVAITTTPDFAPGIYRGEDGGTLTVSAQITDVSGVRNVCLQVEGETGCPHTGSSLDGGLWTFTMPRAPTVGSIDGTPVSFTVAADDAPDAGAANHGTATGFVRFDNSGPDIRIAVDPQPYARLLPDGGADVIRVEVVIADATGVCQAAPCRPKMTVGASPPAVAAAQDGGSYFFDVDATKVASGTEGALEFTITAQDSLGHVASASGSRLVDDNAPALTLKVFRDGDPEPPSGAGFPTAAPNTGHDGLTFIYSDVVHLKGTVADQGGIGAVTWRIDGVALDGGVSTGTAHPVCDGGTACSFDVQVALNAPGNGELHTTTADLEARSNLSATNGATRIPVADLHVVVTATDRTQTAAHEGVAKQTLRSVTARTTRFVWLANLPAGRIVHGLAIHPNGDLVATTESPGPGAMDEVFALPTRARPLPDGGFPLDWSFGAGAGLGAAGFGDVADMPAIGAGDATTALVYVATTDGGVFALRADGGEAWRSSGRQELWTAPAVVDAEAGETVVVPSVAPGAAANVFTLRSAGDGGAIVTSATIEGDDFNSAPLVLDGGVYFGTTTTLTRFDLLDGGVAGADAGGEIWSPISDGGVVHAATISTATSSLSTFTPSLVLVPPAATVTGAVNQDLIVDMNGRVVAATRDSQFVSIDPVSGALTSLGDLEVTNGDGKVPLQGSDGTLYVPRQTGFLLAFRDGLTSWTFDPNGNVFRALAMDCSGRLYVASDETIYALVTDDRGLADAPWPTYRRDSRATGNFGAPKYGMRLPGPDGGVCDN